MAPVIPSVDEIVARISTELFSRPLLTNIHRAAVVEAIVAFATEPDWIWCSGDYSSFDFRHRDGARLEVKQSATLQSWNAKSRTPSKCAFDIAARTGEWEDGVRWVERPGRNADIYLLCHHPLVTDNADHRDPTQWRFYIVPESSLPQQKTIGLSAVEKLATAATYAGLLERLSEALPRTVK